MLCSRPNEDLYIQKDKAFVSRVDPKTQIGINPVRKMFDLATKTSQISFVFYKKLFKIYVNY